MLQLLQSVRFSTFWKKIPFFSLGGEWPHHSELNMQLWSSLWGPYSNVPLLTCLQVLISDYFLFTECMVSFREPMKSITMLQVDLLRYNLITVLQMPPITRHSCVRVASLRSCSVAQGHAGLLLPNGQLGESMSKYFNQSCDLRPWSSSRLLPLGPLLYFPLVLLSSTSPSLPG